MSENSQDTSEVHNYFVEYTKPSEEDLKRVFTEEELKELCSKHKCKVDIWRWNPVNDYRILFTESGRYQEWSERGRLRMLAKAVNKMKPSVLYEEDEIARTRKEEWKLQLKENILSLNYWKRQSALRKSEEINPELQFEINTESINAETEIMPATCGQFNRDSITAAKFTQTVEGNIIVDDFEEDYLTDSESEDSCNEDAGLKEKQNDKSREVLNSDEIAIEIENIYDINTISMSFDSESSIQSQDLQTLHTPQIMPPNYDSFKNVIPLTSTQSQREGTEQVFVAH